MSLVDALLLEPSRDPREVYIALRTDGVKGSGTVDDPYDGSSRDEVGKLLTGLSNTGMEATATTSDDHGYLDGEVVTISGVGGTGAAQWNGTFIVFSLGANAFKYTMGAVPVGSASLSGNSFAAKRNYRFDDVMRSLSDGSCVHIGPGIFETRGFDPLRNPALNWMIRPGHCIRGSGIGVTTLRLMYAVPWSNPELTAAIANNAFAQPNIANADNAEVRDLTVDCNMRAQAADRVAKGAVLLRGAHVSIRRMRAIDYGTHVYPIECFVFVVGQADPRSYFTERVNMRIEDCILEQPSLNGMYTNTCMILSSGEDGSPASPTYGIKAYHRGSAIRHNYVNNEYIDSALPISSIQYVSGAWVVRTIGAYGRANNDWVVISGAVDSSGIPDTEGFSIHFNGSFKVSGVSGSDPTAFQITPAGSPATTLAPTGDMWVGKFKSHRISVKKVELVSSSPPIAKLTSYTPHNRKPGQWVWVWTTTSPVLGVTAPYFGRFKVLEDGMTSTELKYELDAVPDASCASDQSGSGCTLETIFMGVSSVGFSTDGGSEAVAEGNVVFRSIDGGSYHDTWATKDQTDRNNYASDVLAGPRQSLNGIGYLRTAKNVSASGSTVTIETFYPHGMVKGQAVTIQPFLDDSLKNYFLVTSGSEVSTTLFIVEVSGTINLTPPYQFANLFQVRRAIRSNNVVELGQVSPLSRSWGPPRGVVFYSEAHDDQYVFQEVIIENNIVGLLPGSVNSLGQGAEFREVESGLVRGNVFEVINSIPVLMGNNQPLHFFGNIDWSGDSVRPPTGTDGNDVASQIQDALVLSL